MLGNTNQNVHFPRQRVYSQETTVKLSRQLGCSVQVQKNILRISLHMNFFKAQQICLLTSLFIVQIQTSKVKTEVFILSFLVLSHLAKQTLFLTFPCKTEHWYMTKQLWPRLCIAWTFFSKEQPSPYYCQNLDYLELSRKCLLYWTCCWDDSDFQRDLCPGNFNPLQKKTTVSLLAINERPTTYGTSWLGFVSSNISQLRVGTGRLSCYCSWWKDPESSGKWHLQL